MLGITDFRDKLGRELSTGSRRIVDLACVLAHGPSVLLLDEPSSGIAQREAEALGPLLLRIREQTGATLLVIEHDVPLLLSVSDRLIALDLGEIVSIGKPGRGRTRSDGREVVSRHNRRGDRTKRRARARLSRHRNQGEQWLHSKLQRHRSPRSRVTRPSSRSSSWWRSSRS